MALRVVWAGNALRDRNSILDFYKVRNGSARYSQELIRRFRDNLRLAASQELMGKKTDVHGVRCLVVLDYSVFYTIDGDDLVVLSIWDNRRDPGSRPY